MTITVTDTPSPVTLTAPVITQRGKAKKRPYVLIGGIETSDFSTLDTAGQEATLLLHIFTAACVVGDVEYLGSEVAERFAEIIAEQLTAERLLLADGWTAYDLDLQHSEVFEDDTEEAGGEWHGILRFTVIVDQKL